MPDALLDRGVNTEFSGGEKKRAETVQLAVLEPKFAVLDEIDSGLDVDALRDVARRVYALAKDRQVGVLAITHYARLLAELRPDRVHVFLAGRIVKSGGPSSPTSWSAPATRGSRPSSASTISPSGRPAERPTRSAIPTIGSNPFAVARCGLSAARCLLRAARSRLSSASRRVGAANATGLGL